MSERQYIVTINKGVDFDQFNQEMVTPFGSETIPNRTVDVPDSMPLSKRNTVYALSNEEAQVLRNDSRVRAVELTFDEDDASFIEADAIQNSRFDKFIVASSGFQYEYVNWGLRRCIEKDNSLWGTNEFVGLPTNGIVPSNDEYRYVLDGTGVDVVIHDSGVHLSHPEFHDADGISRVVQYDWYSTPGVSGSLPTGYYSSPRIDNHGTNVASIVAGKTYGWAKNAAIYDLTCVASPWKIEAVVSLQLLLAWHNNKSVDPATGVKRPTVVNASWSYYWGYDSFNHVTQINYRNSSKTGSQIATQALRDSYGFVAKSSGKYNQYNTSLQSEIEVCIEAGIHFVTSAGNRSFMIDVPGGQDYNNSVTDANGTRYYHRGKSPGGKALGTDSSAVIVVGNIDRDIDTVSGKERKHKSSETGPGVDVYAPGTKIAGAWASAEIAGYWTYPENGSFYAGHFNTGTSFSAPQVAGVVAMFLQMHPQATPEQAKEWIMQNSIDGEVNKPSFDYAGDYHSLLEGDGKYLFSPINSDTVLNIE
jgi:hypothetical protein